MLHNEVYVGTLVYNRENKHKRHGKHKYNPKDKWIIVENAHQPIIPVELWEIVQARTKQAFVGGRFPTKGNRPRSNYLLSGLIKCGKCGSNFHGSRYHRKYSITRVYCCGGYNMYGNNVCTRWEVNAGELEDFIRVFVKSVVMYPKTRQAKITLYRRPKSAIISESKECKECNLTEEIEYQN